MLTFIPGVKVQRDNFVAIRVKIFLKTNRNIDRRCFNKNEQFSNYFENRETLLKCRVRFKRLYARDVNAAMS